MLSLIKFIHLSSLVVWIGMIVFFSFFAAPSIFKVLPRETAGEVVGAIFPKYWIMGYISSVAALATLLVISYAEKTLPIARVLILAIMTVTTFYSGLVVGKRAVSIKAQIKAAEEPAEKESLRVVFKKVHEKSSRLNMAVLALGVLLVFLTAQGL
jgi:small-conductance mechanosensitive channel